MNEPIRAEHEGGRHPGHEAASGADALRWATDRSDGRYRAIAEECLARAEEARLAPDREAWLRLAADWNTLADDMMRRRDHI
jgi:hypothetical protein